MPCSQPWRGHYHTGSGSAPALGQRQACLLTPPPPRLGGPWLSSLTFLSLDLQINRMEFKTILSQSYFEV